MICCRKICFSLFFVFLVTFLVSPALAEPNQDIKIQSRTANFEKRLLDVEEQNEELQRMQKLHQEKISEGAVLLNAMEKHLEENNRWLESGQERIDWWFSYLSIFFTVISIGIAVGGAVIPLFIVRRQRDEHKRALEDLAKIQEVAEQRLLDIEKHRDHARNYAEQAKEHYEDVLARTPETPPTQKQKEATVEVSQDKNAPPAVLMRALALKAQDKKDWRTAAVHWNELADLEPENANAWFGVGISYHFLWLEIKDPDVFSSAVLGYQRSIELKPNLVGAFNNWGNLVSDLAKTKEGEAAEELYLQAVVKFRRAVEIKPNYFEALNNWGITLIDQAKTKEGEAAEALYLQAQEKFHRAIEAKPDYVEAFNSWGIALTEQAKTKEGEAADALLQQAVENYRRALEIKPDFSAATSNWGITLNTKAKASSGETADVLFQQAHEKFRRAVELSPDYYEAFNNWGVSLLDQAKTKQGDEAEKYLAEAVAVLFRAEKISSGAGSYNLACVYSYKGDTAEAKKWLKMAKNNGTLPNCAHLRSDGDLLAVRGMPWFQNLLEEVCE